MLGSLHPRSERPPPCPAYPDRSASPPAAVAVRVPTRFGARTNPSHAVATGAGETNPATADPNVARTNPGAAPAPVRSTSARPQPRRRTTPTMPVTARTNPATADANVARTNPGAASPPSRSTSARLQPRRRTTPTVPVTARTNPGAVPKAGLPERTRRASRP